MRARIASLLAVNEEQFRLVANVTLALLTLIVFTGAAVRLSDSGLGCPTWPRCYGHVYPPVATHALIEFGNRALSGLVGLITVGVAVLAFTRRPYRRDLALLALLMPLGVLAQAILGGFTVREHLAPGFVMSHFLLSMVILIGAVALAWRATHAHGWRPTNPDNTLVWCVRCLAGLTFIVLIAGTAASAAGPHSGGTTAEHTAPRLMIEGKDTLEWAVHQHATIAALLGVLTIAVWFLKRHRGVPFDAADASSASSPQSAARARLSPSPVEHLFPLELLPWGKPPPQQS